MLANWNLFPNQCVSNRSRKTVLRFLIFWSKIWLRFQFMKKLNDKFLNIFYIFLFMIIAFRKQKIKNFDRTEFFKMTRLYRNRIGLHYVTFTCSSVYVIVFMLLTLYFRQLHFTLIVIFQYFLLDIFYKWLLELIQ